MSWDGKIMIYFSFEEGRGADNLYILRAFMIENISELGSNISKGIPHALYDP
jgi:hypothetical protein